MKKLFFLISLSTIAYNTYAQDVYVQGGLNLANITQTKSGNTEENNLLTSFNAGIMFGFGISKTFDIEAGLLFTGKGAKAETNFSNSDYVKSKFNPFYVEIPANAKFIIPMDKETSFFVTAGPYIAMGVAGKSKTDSKFGPISSNSEEDIKFSNDDPFTSSQDDAAYDKLKRFDFGVNLGFGFNLDKVILKANYGHGLSKINSTESNNNADDKNKYRTVSVSIGIPLD